MSAYVVSHKHINVLLTFANLHDVALYLREPDGSIRRALRACIHDELQQAAEILLEQNIKSVQARYPDVVDDPQATPGRIDEIGQPITFQLVWDTRLLSPVQIIKACQCYRYQACETGDYEQTSAASIVRSIMNKAIDCLPGYGDAKWGID